MRAAIVGLLAASITLAPAWSSGFDGGATTSTPWGLHLSHTDDPTTTMTVAWFTTGATDPGTVVQYGTEGLTHVATGSSHLATPAGGEAVRVHETVLHDLAPGTLYNYQVGSVGSWSDTYTFRTGTDAARFRLAVFGDHGTDDPASPPALHKSQRTTATVLAGDPDLVLIVGDLSYANGDPATWDLWFRQLEPLAARVPVMTAIGNHEWEGAHGTDAYRSRLALPGAELYYSFDHGRVHVLVLQSHIDGLAGDAILADMVTFAEADLAAAAARRDAGALDFIVLAHHHPLYSNEEGPERRLSPHLVALEEQWSARYGIDLLLVGHDHYYDRSRPMLLGQPTTMERWTYEDPLGVIMVVTGGGGQSLYDFSSELFIYPWSATHAKRYHHVALDFDAGTVIGRAVSTGLGSEGEVFDEWSLSLAQSSSSTGNNARHEPWPAARTPSGVQ